MRYRQRVAIQAATRIAGSTGQLLESWADVGGLSAVPAMILPAATERFDSALVVVEDVYQVMLAGRHPEIRPGMRVVAPDGSAYRISDALPSATVSATSLTAHRLTPEGSS